MSIPLAKSSSVFLVAIGEMSARIRDFDWAATPLGPIEQWSSSLRAAVALITASPVPNILVCGPGRVLIYNDACFELYGDKHPGALGSKGPDVFPKLWDELGPLFDRVFAGDPLRLEARPWGDRPGGSLYDTFVAPG